MFDSFFKVSRECLGGRGEAAADIAWELVWDGRQ
jgi:hypothetical protein